MPVAGLQELQYRGRTGSSFKHYMRNLEQSAGGVLRDNSGSPSRMLTLIHTVQLVPGEDYAGNTPRTPHIHLH